MKKNKVWFPIFIVMTVCLVLLAGCRNDTASVKLPDQNNKVGTQAVNVPDNISVTAASIPESAADNNSWIWTEDSPASAEDSFVAPTGDFIEIKEKMFVAQTNDIYINPDDYLGKTIKYEGIFDLYTWEEENLTYYSVIRYGPGCCGTDANAGFEVVWDSEYPDKNDWVEAVGVLESYDEDGYDYLRLRLTSLTVLPTRGAENVYQ